MEMSCQIHSALTALRLGKEYEYLLSRRVGGPQSQAVRFEVEINILFISVMEPRISQPVT